MRCAVPSSKVGSCDSASAAAERVSGVDAATAALPGIVRAGPAQPPGAAAEGLGTGAGLAAPAGLVFWANAGAVANKSVTARIVVDRISKIPGDALVWWICIRFGVAASSIPKFVNEYAAQRYQLRKSGHWNPIFASVPLVLPFVNDGRERTWFRKSTFEINLVGLI